MLVRLEIKVTEMNQLNRAGREYQDIMACGLYITVILTMYVVCHSVTVSHHYQWLSHHSLTVEAAFFENFHLLLCLEPERGDAVQPVFRHHPTEEWQVGRTAPG